MSRLLALRKLERLIVPRKAAEDVLADHCGLGMFVALLAPLHTGRSTLLRSVRSRLEAAGMPLLLIRPDQTPELSREVFLEDFLRKLRQQLQIYGITLPTTGGDPYLSTKQALAQLTVLRRGPMVVACDDIGGVETRHLRSLLWIFRELHSQRADEGWGGPLDQLSIVVAGSRRLFDLTVGHDDSDLSPFNVAELFHLEAFSQAEVSTLIDQAVQAELLTVEAAQETAQALTALTGGHPALIKSILAEQISQGGSLSPSRLGELEREVRQDDRTLLEMWERLEVVAGAQEEVRKVMLDGLRPPSNLTLLPESLRAAFWFGWLATSGAALVPRGPLLKAFVADRSPSRGPAKVEPRSFAPALLPEGLVRGFAEGQGVLFVGAGVSCTSGLPSWASLSASMSRRILDTARSPGERSDLENFLAGAGPTGVAQLLRDRLGAYEYHRFLVGELRKPLTLSSLHQALKTLSLKLILTTNFDRLLEKTFRTDDEDLQVVVSTPELSQVEEGTRLSLLKLHGDIDRPETIVLTADDYDRYFDEHRAIRRFLEHQFRFRTVLFVGFGLKDPNFELIFREARRTLAEFKRPAYAVMVGMNPIEAERWKALGIHIIPLERYEDIPDWTLALTNKITPR